MRKETTELKTLKDISGGKNFCMNHELKAEAVKWVKGFEENQKRLIEDAPNYEIYYFKFEGMKRAIKSFFNLKEGDLK